MPLPQTSSPAFSTGGSMAERINGFDWTSTELGPRTGWPAELQAVIAVMLRAAVPMSVYAGPELRFLYNDHAAAQIGAKHPNALGRPAREVWAELWDELGPLLDGALRGGEAAHAEDQLLPMRRDGEISPAWFSWTLTPVLDAQGRGCGLFATSIETTDKMQAEARRKSSERRLAVGAGQACLSEDFRVLFESAPGPMLVLTPADLRIVAINDAFLQAAMGEREALIGRNLFEVFPDDPDDPEADGVAPLRASLERVIETGQADAMDLQYYPIRRPDGSFEERWWSPTNSPVLGADGEVALIIHRVEDVTDRRRAELALAASEARFEAIANSIDQMIWSTLPDGFHDYYNDRWYEFTGVPAGSTDGEAWNGVFHPEDQARAWARWRQSLETGTPYHIEYRLRHRSGEYRWVIGRAQPVRNARGQVVRWYGSCTDIHDLKVAENELRRLNETLENRVIEEVARRMRTEEVLRQSQKMEAIGQLTGGVAHDFNNLLTVIRSGSDLLKRPGLSQDKRDRYLAAISDTADRAAKLTAQLLAFARRQALRPEVFEVGERVSAIVDMLKTVVGARIELVADLRCQSCFIEADPTQFETALVNMAVNARDAMNGAGRLVIRVDQTAGVPPIRGHSGAPGPFISVTVEDSGAGIPPENLAHIFEPFFTTKQVGKGTGLGLSQVYGFAKQSGGEVNVASEPGKGTAFTLYLPRVDAVASAAVELPDESDAPSGRGHLLVVEDNEQVGGFATQLLSELGYETTWAANASEALVLLEAGHDRFAAVFTDVVMPGISGVELGHEIRRRWPDLPVVLTSGYSHVLAEDARHGFALLHKPYSIEELTRILSRAIRRPALETAE